MALVTIKCPDCNREAVYNGRGECTCGTYLVHDFAGNDCILRTDQRTWVRIRDNLWKLIPPE